MQNKKQEAILIRIGYYKKLFVIFIDPFYSITKNKLRFLLDF